MRLLFVVLIIALVIWKVWLSPSVKTDAGKYVSPQKKMLDDARGFEDDYIDAHQQRQEDMKRQVDDGG